MTIIKVTINILDILHKSEKDIVITTKSKLIKEDQKLSSSQAKEAFE